jgi:hypothetical protein
MSKKIINTAPARTGRVTARDFKALKGCLTLEFNYYASTDRREMIRAWNKFVPLSPKTAYEILTRELPPGTVVQFSRLSDNGDGHINIERDGDDKNKSSFSNSRDFDLGAGTVATGSVTVGYEGQERGTGRRTMRNQIEFFHACGVRTFDIYASSHNGGYTWARLGFLPKDMDESFRREIRNAVRGHMKKLGDVLPASVTDELDKALKLRRRTDLWRIADLNTDLVPILSRTFNDNAALRTAYEDDYNDAVKAGRPLPLGRVLLTGTSWDGVLDLSSRKQMKRIGAYCGGWKYIDLK